MGKNLVIIGGGAAGASTAAEAKRGDPSLNITILEGGKFVSYASCPTPYYIGDIIKDENNLIARTQERFRETGIDVQLNTQVVNISNKEKIVTLKDGRKLPFDILTLATGTKALTPYIPGVDKPGVFTLKNLEDAIKIKNYLRENKCRKAVIIGAGFIAMEMSEGLHAAGVKTLIIHRGSLPANRWDAEFSKFMLEELKNNGVEFVPTAETTSIETGSKAPLSVVTDQGKWDADMVLLAIGVKPDVHLAEELGITIGKTGAVAVNHFQQTSQKNIYAAGDCCESWHRVSRRWVNIPLGDIANKQGRVAGHNIGGKPFKFAGIVGAQSFRLFNLEAAATGIDEKEAALANYNPVSTLVWGNAIVGSLGEKKIGLKLVADKSSGKLLGAQTVGFAGAVSRINSLSVALWAEMNLDDISYLDLAYSPFFSGAWDIIHNAAQALRRAI
jgi:NADPH-dependent 2,4-dienoyl-CoA reductase/sulfur reductase-like enzyme